MGCIDNLYYVLLIVMSFDVIASQVLVPTTAAVNVSVMEGDLAILPCPVRNIGQARVLWLNPEDYAITMNRMRVISDSRFSVDQTHLGSWDLVIKNVRKFDSGLWSCKVTSEPPVTVEVQLHVEVPPPDPKFYSQSPLEIAVQVGGEAILPCSVTDMGNYTVTWLFEDFPLHMKNKDEYENERLSMKTQFNLRIADVGHTDAGKYTCQINTKPTKKKEVQLIVRGPVIPVVFGLENVGPMGDTSTATETVPGQQRATPQTQTDKQTDSASECLTRADLDGIRQDQRKTDKLQRRVLQEQLDFYRHMNHILENSRDDIVKYFKQEN